MNRILRNSIILVVLLILLLTIGIYIFQFHNQVLSDNTSNWGAFGGYISGIVGTFLSILSVILIYLTYSNQVKVSAEQHKALLNQQKNSLLQQFENTFFNLLQVQREILKSLHTKGMYEHGYIIGERIDTNLHGADYIEWISKKIEEKITLAFINWTSTDRDEIQQKITDIYSEVCEGQEAMLWHYFRHLYHIVKYIDESSIEDKKKQKYIDIISAQMDDNEHYIEFYNCISWYHGWEKLLPLLDKYHFSENVNSRNEIFEQHKIFYPNTTFKSTYKE